MRYSLDDIWNQPINDSYSANLDGFGYKSRIVYGVKIIRDDETGDVIIYNTSKGGDYYQELNEDELKKILGIPEEVRFVVATPVAYPAMDSYDEAAKEKLDQRTRKDLQELVYLNAWGKKL